MPLLDYLPPRYRKIPEVAALQAAMQPQVDALHDAQRSFIAQLDVATATWGLALWEKSLGIEVDEASPADTRRSRIYAKQRTQGTTTPDAIRNVVSSYYDGDVTVIEYPHEYRFVLEMIGPLQMPVDWPSLTAAVEELKPAHLAYDYSFAYQTGTLPIYGGFCLLMGDELEFTQRRPDFL